MKKLNNTDAELKTSVVYKKRVFTAKANIEFLFNAFIKKTEARKNICQQNSPNFFQ